MGGDGRRYDSGCLLRCQYSDGLIKKSALLLRLYFICQICGRVSITNYELIPHLHIWSFLGNDLRFAVKLVISSSNCVIWKFLVEITRHSKNPHKVLGSFKCINCAWNMCLCPVAKTKSNWAGLLSIQTFSRTIRNVHVRYFAGKDSGQFYKCGPPGFWFLFH